MWGWVGSHQQHLKSQQPPLSFTSLHWFSLTCSHKSFCVPSHSLVAHFLEIGPIKEGKKRKRKEKRRKQRITAESLHASLSVFTTTSHYWIPHLRTALPFFSCMQKGKKEISTSLSLSFPPVYKFTHRERERERESCFRTKEEFIVV